MTICGHEFKTGVTCGKEKGHDGVHSFYKSVPEGCIALFWNDDCETERPELCEIFPCDYAAGKKVRMETMRLAINDAKKTLPPGEVFEIRAKEYPVDREAEKDWGIAWYVIPKQPKGFEHLETKKSPLLQNDVDEGIKDDEFGGYVLLARIKA